MVICRFFQQSNCRFGQNCRYEHSYSSKYSYHAPVQNTVTDKQLESQVQSDIAAALNGGQWILSCYAPDKEKPCFPGIQDISQEEARLMIYEAKNNNNLDEAVKYMNNVFKETRQKYQHLLSPNAQILKVLRKVYNGETAPSPFNSNPDFGTNHASSLFHSAQKTAFGQNNSVFSRLGEQNTLGGSNPKSLFGQANQKEFGSSHASNIFQTANQQHPAAAKSLFAQASQNVFGVTQQASQNIFSINNQQNVFSSNQPTSQNVFKQNDPFTHSNPFKQNDPFNQTNSNVFGISKPIQKTVDNYNIFSKMDDLSQSDLEAFQSKEFQLGFVPELPPPHSLCV